MGGNVAQLLTPTSVRVPADRKRLIGGEVAQVQQDQLAIVIFGVGYTANLHGGSHNAKRHRQRFRQHAICPLQCNVISIRSKPHWHIEASIEETSARISRCQAQRDRPSRGLPIHDHLLISEKTSTRKIKIATSTCTLRGRSHLWPKREAMTLYRHRSIATCI